MSNVTTSQPAVKYCQLLIVVKWLWQVQKGVLTISDQT